MEMCIGVLLIILRFFALSTATPIPTQPNVSNSALSDAQNATNFALTYGFPLLNYAQFIHHTPHGKPNTVYHNRNLSTASTRVIVRPNVDTLYSQVYFDLSSVDVEITVPCIKDRFWVFPFYDFYGNNYANIGGTVTNFGPGKYLLRFTKDDFGLKRGDCKYRGYINTPTPYGAILIRIVVKGASDVENVNKIQDEIEFVEVRRPACSPPVAPALRNEVFNLSSYGGSSDDENLLHLTALTAPYNQPEVLGDRPWVKHTLETAGLEGGNYTKPSDVSVLDAHTALNVTIISNILNPDSGSTIPVGNGWNNFAPKISGNFYSLYWARAFIAWAAYMQVTPDVALYPSWESLKSVGGISIGKDEAYLFTFSGKPPLVKDGFWSLTAYADDGYLIPNQHNVYSLGDRSKLNYANGVPLYGPEGAAGVEKPFQILVQPADVLPPKNWTDNWLPAPAGGGLINLNLRFYGPTPALSNGSYIYPVVTKVKALQVTA